MSLLCAYSDSSASSSEDENAQTHVPARQEEVLPSVDDLFASSTSTARVSASMRSSTDASKRKAATEIAGSVSKRSKGESGASDVKPAPVKKPIRPFAPPQLKRPNVSTEDTGAWNTQKTMEHRHKTPRPDA